MRFRGFTTGWKRAAIAAALAYVLVLQGLLLSLGGALHAAEASGPQTIICVEGTATGQDRAPLKAHDALCCTLSCHGSTAAGPLPAFSVLKRRAPAVLEIEAAGEPAVLRVASHVLPLGSRAPPRLG
ncbi:MAG TPA: hypothetical protein VE423_12550 [Microvirga sp.]|nr:hypothetical protein [Microvirga sp.]